MQVQRTKRLMELHENLENLGTFDPMTALHDLYVGKKADPMAAHDIDHKNYLHGVYVGSGSDKKKKRR